jgi:hypothetical protein
VTSAWFVRLLAIFIDQPIVIPLISSYTCYSCKCKVLLSRVLGVTGTSLDIAPPSVANAIMPSEFDPLLPQNAPSPEISGYGYSKSKQNLQPELVVEDEQDYEPDEPATPADPSSSPGSFLSTMIGLFTFVVAVGLLIATLMGNSPGARPIPSRPSRPGISERVERILDGTPLIGLTFSFLRTIR